MTTSAAASFAARERYDNVIVPFDGSTLAERAVAQGRMLAEATGAKLHLFHAEPHDDRREGGMHRETQALAERIGALAEVRPLGIDNTSPAEAIDRFAGELGNAALCMATHGRGRLLASVMGSVTADVVARGRPVVVVGPGAAPAPAPIDRVVACLDSSTWSEEALPEAAGWAKALGVPLWLVEVIDPKDAAGHTGGDLTESTYVHGVARDLRAMGIELEWETLHDDKPGAAILRFVGESPKTLTVLATHGRSGVRRAMAGSVAGAVIHDAAGPVVVLRPQG